MEKIIEYLPLLLPILLIEWVLAIVAVIHVWNHPHYKFGNKIMWIFVVLVFQIVGPICYFLFGRGEE